MILNTYKYSCIYTGKKKNIKNPRTVLSMQDLHKTVLLICRLFTVAFIELQTFIMSLTTVM